MELLDAHLQTRNQDTFEGAPENFLVTVEGLPGTGKTFVIKTIRNITRKLHSSNMSDMATTPTGCAADLIGGSTHYRACKIPVGKQHWKTPKALT